MLLFVENRQLALMIQGWPQTGAEFMLGQAISSETVRKSYELRTASTVAVDLYRNLTQKRPFLASKVDPPTVAYIFEKVVFVMLEMGHFQSAKAGSI